jgi:glucose/arabinose dehydrogenase
MFSGPFKNAAAQEQPTVKDSNLKVETVVQGLTTGEPEGPTSMGFIDNNNILVLEKNGNVMLVSNGVLKPDPILKLPVDTTNERGLLGIAIKNDASPKEVFLYFTESKGSEELRNRVYKYQWNGQSLVQPSLILDLPALPGPNHNAGKLLIGPDHYLYAIIGELRHNGNLQNIKDGPDPDDTGVIFRVNPDNGSPAPNNPFSKNANNGNNSSSGATADTSSKLSRYYAYGIRNSFGLAIDPVTGNVWDTENGPSQYDEINYVRPGFNSGWKIIMGPISRNEGVSVDQLVNFPGSKYADPVFSWKKPVAVTAIEFLKSSKLGQKYMNNVFVGDYKNGNLYYFEVNSQRNGFKFDNATQAGLADLVVDDKKDLSSIIFGQGFGGISDIKTGPDGLLYIVSIENGVIYKVHQATS